MKKQNIIFWVVNIILDFLIILIAFFLARELRLISDFVPGINLQIQTIDTYNLFIYSLIAWFILIFLFSVHWLYKIKLRNSKIKEFIQIIIYWFYSFLLFSVFVYLWSWFIFNKEIPRLIIWFAFFLAIIFIIIERILINNLQNFLLKKKLISKNNLIIINNKKEKCISEILKDIKKAWIYKILGYSNISKIEKNSIKFIGFENLKRKIRNRKIDEIIYIDSDFTKKELYELWELTRIFWVRYRYLTNNFDITKINTELSLINEIPVLELKGTQLNWWNILLKRVFDIFSSLFWIIIFFPLLLIIYILIKIENPKAPAIFKNKRVWKDAKEFDLYKFRYMKWEFCTKDSYNVSKQEKEKVLNFEQNLINKKSTRNWPLYKIKNDPRKTNLWIFIEKYSIDELPQFFNVFVWNMSLVWPRPHQPREVEKYLLKHKRLLTIKPWITWMAQVNGREENDFEKEAELDIYYIENWTILLDLKIILKTFSSVIWRIIK